MKDLDRDVLCPWCRVATSIGSFVTILASLLVAVDTFRPVSFQICNEKNQHRSGNG